jgi:hypothetical protein
MGGRLMRWPVIAEFTYKRLDKKGDIVVNSSGKIRARKFFFRVKACPEHGESRKDVYGRYPEKCQYRIAVGKKPNGFIEWDTCNKDMVSVDKAMVCCYTPSQSSIDVPSIISRFTLSKCRVSPNKWGPPTVNFYAINMEAIIKTLDYWNYIKAQDPERIKKQEEDGEYFDITVKKISEEDMDAYVHQYKKEQIIKKI